MLDEKSAQQRRNMKSIGVRISEDANLAIAQTRKIRGAWVYSHGDSNIMHFLRGEYLLRVHLPGIKNLSP